VIAILGATGSIGPSLAGRIVQADAGQLSLFAREPAKLADGLSPSSVRLRPLTELDAGDFTTPGLPHQ
jgi:hypothetical protein